MALLDLPWCDFVVWTPDTVDRRRFVADPHYWRTCLLPALQHYYFQVYLPLAVREELGLAAQPVPFRLTALGDNDNGTHTVRSLSKRSRDTTAKQDSGASGSSSKRAKTNAMGFRF